MLSSTFPYDPQILAIVRAPVQSIAGFVDALQRIDATCVDGDGLKWFNHLYMTVTQTVQDRVNTGGFRDSAWLRELDVQFGRLYFSAMSAVLQGVPCPGCWRVPLSVRADTRLARVQFALAGVNAHINHDLPEAIVATARATGMAPVHGSAQHLDYLSLNPILETLIERAKADLHVRLLGDPLPPISHIEDTIAAWGLTAARDQAWSHAEALWAARDLPVVSAALEDGLDGLTTFGNKALLVPA